MGLLDAVPRMEKPVPTKPATTAPVQPPPELQTMAKEALVFLDDPIARKLAVAWSLTGGNEDEWLDVAGIGPLDRSIAVRLCTALRRNGICRAGGVTDSDALAYIRAIVAEPLLKGNRRAKK